MNKFNLQNAINFCRNMEFAGHSDWRLPTVTELESLIDRNQFEPALPVGHPFQNVQIDSFYWSSTLCSFSHNLAWYVFIRYGYARSKDSALLQLILNQTERFNETIQVTEQSKIVPLAGDFTEGENLFIIGSPDEEMTDEEFVEDMRTIRLDHLPDGWPAVQTWKIDRLIEIIDNLREQLSPKWTKELPTETGMYWAKRNGDIQFGEVMESNGELFFGSSLSRCRHLNVYVDCEWYGPIIPPK